MLKLALTAAALALLVPLCALARAEEPAKAGTGSAPTAISYTPGDLAAARLTTALDMVSRLPGFTFTDENDVRGFAGAASNVLIDGQRPVIKTESMTTLLQRLPIEEVERVDIIRGGAPGVDMQGWPVVANVIRKRIDTLTQAVNVKGAIFTQTGKALPGWSYDATLRRGERQIDIQLSRQISYDDSQGTATRTTRDAITGATTLFENSFNEGDGSVHNARLNYKGPLLGGVLAANGLLSTDEFKNEDTFFSSDTDQNFVSRSHDNRGEIGLDYTRHLAPRLELETIALSKLVDGTQRNTGLVDGSSSLFSYKAEAGESIGRVILKHATTPTFSIEAGGEVAYNYLDQKSALAQDGAPVPLPAANVRVGELRGEVFADATWKPSPKYSLEAGARFEESTITETGDEARERSFTYPKPRVLATWSPTPNNQFRLRIERSVDQLDFSDFASSVNLSQSLLNAGNAELRPDTTWAYEIALERRFWGKGAAVLTLRHEDISDVIDILPVRVPGTDSSGNPIEMLVASRGNIGQGTNDVAQVTLSLPLDNLGLKGGTINTFALFQSEQARDPLTHAMRIISGKRPNKVTATYTQDLPAQHLSFTLFWFAGWSERYYQVSEVQAYDLRNYWQADFEYKPTKRLTLDFGVDNFDPYSFSLERREFNSTRDTGTLASIQTEQRNSQIIATVGARLSFD
jgi:outer membrane receptor for ferrienterochelin and colicin